MSESPPPADTTLSGPLTEAWNKVLDGQLLDRDAALRVVPALATVSGTELAAVSLLARETAARFAGPGMRLCAILNARSGRCSQDCAFCAQSAKHQTNAPVYPLIAAEKIVAAGLAMRAHGVTRFGIVLAGLALSDRDADILAEAVAGLRRKGVIPDVSCGLASRAQLEKLIRAGLGGVHHNLETSARFFPSICTTHPYDADLDAVRLAVSCGIYVCSGGLFGLGETWEDRVDLALTLRALGVQSVPLNFLVPIPGTPLAGRQVLEPEEALRIVALFRLLLPAAHLRLCGGRAAVFGADSARPFTSGVSGVMVGDYLTVAGQDIRKDLAALAQLGLAPVLENQEQGAA